MKLILARHRRRDTRGITLIELLVSMSIFGILASLIFGVLITTQKQTSDAGARLDDVDQVRIAVDIMTRTLRTAIEPAQLQVFCTTCSNTATAFADARTNTLTLYSNTDAAAGPNFVTLAATWDATLQKNVLTKITQPPDVGSAPNYQYTVTCTAGAPGCRITKLTMVRGVVLTAAAPAPPIAPVFQYFDNRGVELLPGSGSLAPSDLIRIDAVNINLTVQTKATVKSTTVSTRVGLPNSGTGVLATPGP